MLKDIGRELRIIALDIIDALEPVLPEMGIFHYVVDRTVGMIILYPHSRDPVGCAGYPALHHLEIQPYPLNKTVWVRAFRRDGKSIKCAYFVWGKNNRTELSETIRRVISSSDVRY
ncbi:MAG: hypothetical protein J5483_01810 [Lachnospiraceae bacterium]|nr:hypothetical protein [Lachnospiraceae bacterium]